MAMNKEMGTMSKVSEGRTKKKRWKKEPMLMPFSVIYLIKTMALVNHIKQIKIAETAKK